MTAPALASKMSDADRLALVAKNADVLRALQAAVPGTAKASLAAACDRDASSFGKTLQVLTREGLLAPPAEGLGALPALTPLGEAELALISGGAAQAQPAADAGGYPLGKVSDIPIGLIDSDPALNPRITFAEEELQGLAPSIRDKGVVQPILVRPYPDMTGHFRIVAGERRWRASKLADQPTIPAMVRELTDAQALEIALIENIQRVDLSPIEEARAYRAIIDARKATEPEMTDLRVKEFIAETTRRTVRYVEQRIDLLVLPEKEQARMSLPADNPQHLGLRDARWAVQSVRREQKQLEERALEPAQLLVMAELIDKVDKDPAKLESYYEQSKPTEIRFNVDVEDKVVKALLEAKRLDIFRDWHNDGRTYARLGWWFSKKDLVHQLPAFGTSKRGDAFYTLRGKVLKLIEAQRLEDEKLYATPWLNGPFEPDPALAEAVAKAQAAAEARATAEREASDRKAASDRRCLDDVDEVLAGLGDSTPLHPLFADAIGGAGIILPVRLNGHILFDRVGRTVLRGEQDWSSDGWRPRPLEIAKLRLMALALNSAGGLETPAENAEVEIPTRDAFERLIVHRWIVMAASVPFEGFPAHATAALDRYLEYETGGDYGDPEADWSAGAADEIADGWADDGWPIHGDIDATDQDEAA